MYVAKFEASVSDLLVANVDVEMLAVAPSNHSPQEQRGGPIEALSTQQDHRLITKKKWGYFVYMMPSFSLETALKELRYVMKLLTKILYSVRKLRCPTY